jgi:hypothetical protein
MKSYIVGIDEDDRETGELLLDAIGRGYVWYHCDAGTVLGRTRLIVSIDDEPLLASLKEAGGQIVEAPAGMYWDETGLYCIVTSDGGEVVDLASQKYAT